MLQALTMHDHKGILPSASLRTDKAVISYFVSQCLGLGENLHVPMGLREWSKTNAAFDTGAGPWEDVLNWSYHGRKRLSWLSRCSQGDKTTARLLCAALESGMRQLDRFHMRLALMGTRGAGGDHFGIVPVTIRPVFTNARVRDYVFLLPNCPLPIVLLQKGNYCRLVCEAYSPNAQNERDGCDARWRVIAGSLVPRTGRLIVLF